VLGFHLVVGLMMFILGLSALCRG